MSRDITVGMQKLEINVGPRFPLELLKDQDGALSESVSPSRAQRILSSPLRSACIIH